ncbi:MAG: response regulator [Oscillospiraceae bacterium]|nr:response regulator [Oscillospiraceae bacterium]
MSNARSKIIIVDDNIANLDQGRNILKVFYEVYPAASANKLFEILENITPSLILMDIDMPSINGFEAMKKLKSDPRFSDVPVIFLTAKSDVDSEREGFDLGAVDYVAKPFSTPLLLKRIENQLLIVRKTNDLLATQSELKKYSSNLEKMVSEKTEEVLELQEAILSTVADIVEFRDRSTGEHIAKTQFFMKTMLDEIMQGDNENSEIISGWDQNLFLQSTLLHDVGKITISDLILNKPGILTPEEFEIMKTHVSAGVDIIERVIKRTKEHAFLDYSLLVIGTHHEKWDGSGYPIGLAGKNIPLEGRLMSIVDVYDACISDRPYKKAFTHEAASSIIENGAGTHFDPALVDAFKGVKDIFAQFM